MSLPKDSVTSKQVKNGSLRTKDFRVTELAGLKGPAVRAPATGVTISGTGFYQVRVAGIDYGFLADAATCTLDGSPGFVQLNSVAGWLTVKTSTVSNAAADIDFKCAIYNLS